VGRQHLRPGLSKVARAPSRRRTAFTTAAVVVVAGLLGLAAGRWRSRSVSRESAFRQMELASRRAPAPELGLVLIESRPPGLEARLEGEPLPGKTPVAIERPRGGALSVEIVRDDASVFEGEIGFEGRLALQRVELEAPASSSEAPPPAELRLVGARRARVRIDGERVGRGSSFRLTPDQPHTLVLRRGRRERTFELTLAPGERRTLVTEL
jgi:hypothetical protein